jgi:ankyrin repeat protein
MRLCNKSVATGAVALVWVASVSAGAGDVRLIEAIKNHDHETLRALIKQQADVNAREGDGATALHWAVVRDDVEAVEELLRAGANTNAANDYGVTPVSLACINRNATVVKKLVAAGADPNAATSMGETALMTCTRTGSADAVAALLDHGANNVNAREKSQGQTALMWAAAQEDPDVVRVLLAHGADVRARSASHLLPVSLGDGDAFREAVLLPQRGFTPLLFAARHGRIESARLLLDAGADVDETAPNGDSALVIASFSDQGKFAAFLLERGANPNAAGAGYAALHTAVLRGDLELVKALGAHGADPNSRITKGSRQQRETNSYALSGSLAGATPFLLAAKYAEIEIMRFLAAKGADPLLSADNGTTPLMAIAGAGWTPTSRNRRDQGVGVDAAQLLVAAGERPTWEGTKVALELGSDVNAIDANGNTALHAAVMLAYSTVVQLLVEHGGKLDIKNKAGKTAQDLMCRDSAGKLVRASGGIGGYSACPDPAR